MHKPIFLFDVDGTLTRPRAKIDTAMFSQLSQLLQTHTVAIVGGSDIAKIREQLGILADRLIVYAENGLQTFLGGQLVRSRRITDLYAESDLTALINWCLRYIANLDLPFKRGTFIEFRTGMLNICPCGRNTSEVERNEFERFDAREHVRADMITAIKRQFPHMNLSFGTGGQVSFDIFPVGWDKTYCLDHLIEFTGATASTAIHFFGDKTFPGGNDHEIFMDPRTIGHSVRGPVETTALIGAIIAKKA